MPERATILIVDDEPLNVDYLEQELEDLDYATLSASDGQTALELVTATAPDLFPIAPTQPSCNREPAA